MGWFQNSNVYYGAFLWWDILIFWLHLINLHSYLLVYSCAQYNRTQRHITPMTMLFECIVCSTIQLSALTFPQICDHTSEDDMWTGFRSKAFHKSEKPMLHVYKTCGAALELRRNIDHQKQHYKRKFQVSALVWSMNR